MILRKMLREFAKAERILSIPRLHQKREEEMLREKLVWFRVSDISDDRARVDNGRM